MPSTIARMRKAFGPTALTKQHEKFDFVRDPKGRARATNERRLVVKRLPQKRINVLEKKAINTIATLIRDSKKENNIITSRKATPAQKRQAAIRMTKIGERNETIKTYLRELEASGAVPNLFAFRCSMAAQRLTAPKNKH